jgi:DNA-binding protein
MPKKESTELDDIKRLLMLLAYKLGATGAEISKALDVDPAVVSRMMPGRKIKPIVKATD